MATASAGVGDCGGYACGADATELDGACGSDSFAVDAGDVTGFSEDPGDAMIGAGLGDGLDVDPGL